MSRLLRCSDLVSVGPLHPHARMDSLLQPWPSWTRKQKHVGCKQVSSSPCILPRRRLPLANLHASRISLTGRTAEAVGNMNKALASYETALRHSPYNAEALTQTASILRQQEKFPEAIEYFTRVVALNETAGDVWGALGHCYLMMDDTSKAYACYQQAIVNLPQSKVCSFSIAFICCVQSMVRRFRITVADLPLLSVFRANQSFGMALAFCTTDTTVSTWQKKLSLMLLITIQVSEVF